MTGVISLNPRFITLWSGSTQFNTNVDIAISHVHEYREWLIEYAYTETGYWYSHYMVLPLTYAGLIAFASTAASVFSGLMILTNKIHCGMAVNGGVWIKRVLVR